MTITLNSHQEEAIRKAIRAGQVASVEEFVERAIAGLNKRAGSLKSTAPGDSRYRYSFRISQGA